MSNRGMYMYSNQWSFSAVWCWTLWYENWRENLALRHIHPTCTLCHQRHSGSVVGVVPGLITTTCTCRSWFMIVYSDLHVAFHHYIISLLGDGWRSVYISSSSLKVCAIHTHTVHVCECGIHLHTCIFMSMVCVCVCACTHVCLHPKVVIDILCTYEHVCKHNTY